MTEFTMCWWLRSTDTSVSKYLLTYRSSNVNTGSFFVKNPNNIQMYVNNQAGVASGIAVNYGLWHHLCMTWDSDDTGRYHYYKDGNMRYTYYNLRSTQTILGGGTLLIGQWQASVGGGLNKVYGFNHEVTKFNIWDSILDADIIEDMAESPCEIFCGNAVSWPYFRPSDISTAVTVKDADIPCAPAEPVCSGGTFEDKLWKFDSTTEYTLATIDKDIRDIWAFTTCWWMSTNDVSSARHTIMSYFAAGDSVSSFLLENPYNLRAVIKNQWGTNSGIAVNYGMWHHVCLTWTADGGTYQIYRDGGLAYTQSSYSANKILRGGGELIIGQKQGSLGGGFNRAYSYYGDLSDFNMWSRVLTSDEIQVFIDNRGCENGCGDIVSWSDYTTDDLTDVEVEDAEAVCEPRTTTCGEGDYDDSKWTLASSSTQYSYATVRHEIPEMSAMTVCMWVKTTDANAGRYIYTYRTSNINTGSIYLKNPNNIQLYIDNAAGTASGTAISYGLWFHICQTWTSANGKYQYFKDAKLRKTAVNLRANYVITEGGTFIIGQWQGSQGGTFATAYSFNAEITKFNMWNKELEDSAIEAMFAEPCGYICGNVISWSYFRDDDIAAIDVADHDLQCEEAEIVCENGAFTNKTMVFDSTTEYTYVTAPTDFQDIWSFTACWWMRTNDISASRAVFSYFTTGDSVGSILVYNPTNLRAGIKNTWATPSGVSVTYGIWHHVCVTWTTDDGYHEFYKDGSKVFSQSNLVSGQLLKGGGKLILGQRQTTSSTFNRVYSYIGELSDFNMWSDIILNSDIEGFAKNRGCENGCGDLISWADFTSSDLTDVNIEDANSVCKPRVNECEEGEFKDKVLVMDNADDFSIVQTFQTIPDMREFTMCWWLKSTDSTASRYLVTYRSSNVNTGSIYVYNPNNLQLWVNNGAGAASSIKVNYGLWQHVCVTWDEFNDGRYYYYKDGKMRYTYYNLRKGQTILGGGTLIIGQWQASVGGGLNKVYGFNHEVTKFNIWSEALKAEEIAAISIDVCGDTCGDIVSWPYFRSSDVSAAVVVKDSDIPCSPVLPLCYGGEYDGKKWKLDSTTEYTFAKTSRTIPDMWEFTICTWIKTADTRSATALVTYLAKGYNYAILIHNVNNLLMYVNNGAATASGLKVNYERWTHLCFTWDSDGGSYQYFQDGSLVKAMTNLQKDKVILGGGDLIVGGRLNTLGGTPLGRAYYYKGEMTNFNMWSSVVDDAKIERMSLEGCTNDCGDIVSWASFTSDEVTSIVVEDSEVECRYEPSCNGGPYENQTLTLDSTSQWSYVMITKQIPDLQEFTMCWWMRTTDTIGYHRSLVSYFAPGDGYYGSVWVEYPINLRMWIKGQAGTYSGMKVNYGLWHHVCVTWNSNGGTYKLYKDGETRFTGINLKSFQTIKGNGVLVLGQEQTKYGGGFLKHNAYYGELANFNMWSDALEPGEIKDMAVAPCERKCGDIMMWSYITASDVVNAEVAENEIECSPEIPVCYGGEYEDKTLVFDSTAEYTYVNVDRTFQDFDELTVCFWMRTNDKTTYPRALMSYRTQGDSYGSILIQYVHNMRMWIGNQAGAFSTMELNYGLWHHVCVTWTTAEGRYQYFKDGNMKYTNINLFKNKLILGGGTMMIGQHQTAAGTFTRTESYLGDLTNFNVWDDVLSTEAIEAMAADGCLTGCGNLVSWNGFTSGDLVDVDVKDSDIECPAKDKCSKGAFRGRAWDIDNTVDWSYASVSKVLPDLTKLSICWWMKVDVTDTNAWYTTIFSYFAYRDWYGSLVFMGPDNLRFYLKNRWSPFTSVNVEDGSWHYLCFTWTSDDGTYKIYDKGQVVYSGSGLATGQTIKGGGSFIIGQKQSIQGGGFYKSWAFNGHIMNFNIWSTVLTGDDLNTPEHKCKGACGNVMSWHEFTYFDVTNVGLQRMRCKVGPDGEIDLEVGEDFTTVIPPGTEEPLITLAPTTTAPEVSTEEPTVPQPTTEPSLTTLEPETTTEACVVPDNLPSVSVNKPATASSKGSGGPAYKAVDGNKNSNLKDGKSCAKTVEEDSPWWKVDLEESLNIYVVTITNRQDCCPEKLLNAEVRVGNSKNIAENAVCGARVSEDVVQQETIEIICDCGQPIPGRYVSVQLQGITGTLTLCEVSVGGLPIPAEATTPCPVPANLPNAAVNKVASQSSQKGGAKALNAVDGIANSDMSTGKSCSRTLVEDNPWWKVDLGESQNVYKVIITNRQDCCPEKLLNAEVRVGDSENIADNEVCGLKLDEDIVKQETIEVICGCGTSLLGRYVSIQLVGMTQTLTLCEVNVAATPLPKPEVTTIDCVVPDGLSNAALGGTATQSSAGKTAYRANDGDKNSNIKGKSCSKTNTEENPWWMVDLGSSRDVYQVTITNRQDCCPEKLLGAEIRVGDSENMGDNTVCGVRVDESNVAKETIEIICACGEPISGRYVSVQLSGVDRTLTLCEVEVLTLGTAPTPTPEVIPVTVFTTDAPCILPDDVVQIITPQTVVSQSSTKKRFSADLAVDGNKDSNFKAGSCTMTQKEREPWILIDLGESRDIYQVTMVNRADCCVGRLKYSIIRVGDSPDIASNPMCSGILGGGKIRMVPVDVVCGCETPMTGRYISVQIHTDYDQALTICEIEVYAAPK
ncbi:uncharacterized protein LOC144453094 [Glandiceps talaboti]